MPRDSEAKVVMKQLQVKKRQGFLGGHKKLTRGKGGLPFKLQSTHDYANTLIWEVEMWLWTIDP